MQTVSAAYDPYVSPRWSAMRASFRLIDLTASADATATASDQASISQLTQTHDGIEAMTDRWATFETGGWRGDGSCAILPDDVSTIQTGWWSDISGADGSFAVAQTLTFAFTADHSSVGFTILFDDKANQYPPSMTVTAYDSSDTLIDTATITVTSVKQVVELPVENYRKVVLSFSNTQEEYQTVRISEVIFGIVQYFDSDNIKEASILYEISPTAENLPSNEFIITVDNSDHIYNIISPNSLYSYLQNGHHIDAELGVGSTKNSIEDVNMGRTYYTKVEADDDSMTAKITFNDRFYKLDNTNYNGGSVGTWTVSAAVAAVIADSGLDITTVIPADIGARIINKCIPKKTKHREAFRLIAQAGMSTCYFNRNDELEFIEVAVGASVDTLDFDNMSVVPKVSAPEESSYNAVRLTVDDEYEEFESTYTASNVADGETVNRWEVSNPLVYDGAAVAAWLLAMKQGRINYDITAERGNPARELCDTATIYDAYNVNRDAVIIRQEFAYDGTLKCDAKGWA